MPNETHSSTTNDRGKRPRSKKLRYALAFAAVVIVSVIWLYTGSLIGVDEATVATYRALQQRVSERGYEPSFFVLSGRRFWIDNKILTTFGGASKNSRHLKGDALDIIVLDVNGDGTADRTDVDIVHRILDEELIGDRGGLGTYKNESGFLNRQMVHFDLRGHRARWNR